MKPSQTNIFKVASRNDLAAFAMIKSASAPQELRMRVRATDSHGTTALMRACRRGNAEMAWELIIAGSDVNAVEFTRGACPLIISASYGSNDCIWQCAQCPELDVRQTDRDEWTALIWAAYNGRPRCVALLLTLDHDTIPLIALFHGARKGRTLCCMLLFMSCCWRISLVLIGYSFIACCRVGRVILRLPLKICSIAFDAFFIGCFLGCDFMRDMCVAMTRFTHQRRQSLSVFVQTPASSPRATTYKQ